MKCRSYRIPGLVARALLALMVAASTSSAQLVGGSAASHTTNLKLDHFFCYIVSTDAAQTTQLPVAATLTDQFFTTGVSVTVDTPLQFCNPVQKTVGTVVTPILNVNDHLTMYHLANPPSIASTTLTAANQFGSAQHLSVDKATTLMVPTQKDSLRFPTRLDHFLCYPVSGASLALTVSLTDQFQDYNNVIVEDPALFCNPVQKAIAGGKTTRIQNPAAHLLCYNVRQTGPTTTRMPLIKNQLETSTFTTTTTTVLCLPSTKTLP